ncbi:MAG: cell division transport system permease protein [Parcubacteria group bacterium Licking1014_17]|nr:MAG: cell division transport system permease protein [Parcubacteria group bacterium Licking1014_17]
MIERVERLSVTFSNWGILATVLLAIIGIMVMFNTIRLTIYNQKQEIEIQRLVGASNWHIRSPYIAEGGFYGLFGALAAMAIFYPVAYLASGKVASFAPDVNIFTYFISNIYLIIPLVVGVGVILGMISSFIAIRKHLRI